MKSGDLVRYRGKRLTMHNSQWELGLLIEYHKWEKIARILSFEGDYVQRRAEHVQLHTAWLPL